MKNLSLYQEFDVVVFEQEQWELQPHGHSFFEIVYIIKGRGTHHLNNNGYSYTPGSIYLLTPEDIHSFDIIEKTTFCIITFNKIYFSKENSKNNNVVDFSELFKKLEIIFNNVNNWEGDLIKSNHDKKTIANLIQNIIHEMEEKQYFFEPIIQNSIFILLNIIARNIQQRLSASFSKTGQENTVGEIVYYIQQHIYSKEKLKMEAIAKHFNKAKNYIGEYYKEQTGQSIKEYIQEYKLNLIKSRLIHSNMTISQIADEFEFIDESHLNKTFKKAFNLTAKEFKKANTLPKNK